MSADASRDADRAPPYFARGLALSKIEMFIAEQRVTAEQFGRRAVGDAEFVDKLKHRPADLTLADVERAEQFVFDFPKWKLPSWGWRGWEDQGAPAEEMPDA